MTDRRVAVLNYHRIVPDGAQREFYDVTESTFASQMRVLAGRGTPRPGGEVRLNDEMSAYVTFDDGTDDHYRAAGVLTDLGLSGVFFVVTGKLDIPGRLTSTQVKEMARAGHRVGSHTVTHARLPETSDDELAYELKESKRALEEMLDTSVDWLAPPGGLFDARMNAAAVDAGYRVIRTMEWGYAADPLEGLIPTLPVIPTYDLDGFARLLDGRAPLWRYRLKTGFKRAVGEDTYVKIRDRAYGLMRRGG
jgi:peptidoglycan/xylan/chitin deacetylase (PgdA/CDA1 family)